MFSTNESERGAFLEHVREAREERQAERLKNDAAIKIQSLVRGWLVRNLQKRQIRFVINFFNKIDIKFIFKYYLSKN